MRQMTYSLTRFGVYDELKKRLAKRHAPGATLPAWELGLAASAAGGLGGLAGNPADVILVRMTADAGRPAEKRLGYKHWCVALSRHVLCGGAAGSRAAASAGAGKGVCAHTPPPPRAALTASSGSCGKRVQARSSAVSGPIAPAPCS